MKSILFHCALATCSIALVLGAPGRADAAGNLVANPGFEAGQFSSWTLSGNLSNTEVSDSFAHTGKYGASLGPDGSDGFISQAIATTIGNTYEVSFWLFSDGLTPNDFSAKFGGVTGYNQTNIAPAAYTQFVFDVVATASTSTLTFGFRNDNGFLALDDVSVTDLGNLGAVPEPSSVVMLGLGALGLAGLVRRRRQAA